MLSEATFDDFLGGEADLDEVAALYASEFIAASPAGVLAASGLLSGD